MGKPIKTLTALAALALIACPLTGCAGGDGAGNAEDLANKVAELLTAGDPAGLQEYSLENIPQAKPEKPVEEATVAMGDDSDGFADAVLTLKSGDESYDVHISMASTDDGWKLDGVGGLLATTDKRFTYGGEETETVIPGVYMVGYDNGWMSGEWEQTILQPMESSTITGALKGHELAVNDTVKTDEELQSELLNSFARTVVPCDILSDALGQGDRFMNSSPAEYSLPVSCRMAGSTTFDAVEVTGYEPTATDGYANLTVSLTMTAPTASFQTYPRGTSYLDFPEDGWACETVSDGSRMEECALFSAQQRTITDIQVQMPPTDGFVQLSDDAVAVIQNALFPNVVPAD